MTSKQIQCEMCCNENAVGHCKTCGYVGETCVNIHTRGKMFQTHIVIMLEAVKMDEDGTDTPKVILWDITEERCKQHPTERAFFLCNIHDSMICGRCLHSEHLSCGREVVDLLHEVVNIDCEKVNTMKSVLKEVKDEILFLKDEAEQSIEICKKNADRCMQECMELGNKIKLRVDELTSDIIHGITKTNDINVSTHSSITQTCNEKTKWCEDEENKIDDFVDNNMAGHLYLMHKHFEKEASDTRSQLIDFKHKHTFKGFDFKENNVILKCLFEDLEEVCEQQEEVTGSDNGSANDVFASTPKINKTRRELNVLLNQAKHELDNSEKTQKELRDELKRVKQELYHSEKEGAVVKAQFSQIKDNIKWTQPTGTVKIDISLERGWLIINLVFTFPDGTQTTHHPSPGKPYKGGTFTGRLISNSEGKLLCRMLKAAFRKGVMFIFGKEGKVVLDGISLYDGYVYNRWQITPAYVKYIQSLKEELAAKGITEADIDQEVKLEETFTVDGSKSR